MMFEIFLMGVLGSLAGLVSLYSHNCRREIERLHIERAMADRMIVDLQRQLAAALKESEKK